MTASEDFSLFPFQEEAATTLREAALDWVREAALSGPPRYGPTPIPFLGQLKAVTGAGKTPILAHVVGDVGPAVVLWTTKSSAVVEQTFRNLRGKYRSLLPKDSVRIIREIPSQSEWYDLLNSKSGLTIWVLTTASWNEAEAANTGGDASARLNLHRPQPDWSGSESPWEQLRSQLKRPLWVVSDESHNQSSVQLDVLGGLHPKGFFMASATPIQNDLFARWQEALFTDAKWRALFEAGIVPVRTREVVSAELLKTTIELIDFHSGTEENLDGVLAALSDLDEATGAEQAAVAPKAIYVVEKSNAPRASPDEARPVVIWRYLRSKGVPADEIAIYTDTRQVPGEAEKVSSLSKLEPRHRHIVFNQALQEGWDDSEAYVAYFDGTTKSFTRIRQIVGRILRQPRAQHFATERMNTATVFINTASNAFDKVLTGLQAELRLYAPEDEPGAVPIRVKTRNSPLPPVPLSDGAKDLGLPRLTLRAPNMKSQETKIRSRGRSSWAPEDLEATGMGELSVLSLEKEDVVRSEYLEVFRSARTENGIYLRRRLLTRNRACLNAIHPDAISGPAFRQFSCQNSTAQQELDDLADSVALFYEDRVTYEEDPDPDRATWRIAEHRPRSKKRIEFLFAAHSHYSSGDFNKEELLFAQALDAKATGMWVRNPSTSDVGYSIPLPVKSADSSRFFPDFLWWTPNGCWAIDTTGKHLLSDKVRGKLVALTEPRVALVVRGRVDLATSSNVDREGWTAVLARSGMRPFVEHSANLSDVLDVFLP